MSLLRDRGAFLTVLLASLSFAAALYASHLVSVWATTTSAALIALLAVAAWHGDRARQLLSPKLLPFVAGGLLGAAMALVTHGAYRLAIVLVPTLQPLTADLYRLLHNTPGPIYGLPLMLIVVTAEELIWRGVLFDALLPRYGLALTTLLSAAAYTLPQATSQHPLLMGLVAFGCGLTWGGVRACSNTLIPALSMHIVWDIAIFALFPLR